MVTPSSLTWSEDFNSNDPIFNPRLAFLEPGNNIWNFAGFATRELISYQ